MVEGVRYLIIKCSKLNNPPPLQISLQMRAILSSLYSWCRIWKGGGNCVKTQLYCSSQPPPDLYALAADKTATQHIAKSHHSWRAPTPARIYCQIYVATHILPNIATSRLKAGAPSSGNILPFSSSYLSQTAKSTCAIIPFVQACPALPFAVLFCPIISTSNLPLFHIIFTGSLYVSLYIIFTKIKPLFWYIN